MLGEERERGGRGGISTAARREVLAVGGEINVYDIVGVARDGGRTPGDCPNPEDGLGLVCNGPASRVVIDDRSGMVEWVGVSGMVEWVGVSGVHVWARRIRN